MKKNRSPRIPSFTEELAYFEKYILPNKIFLLGVFLVSCAIALFSLNIFLQKQIKIDALSPNIFPAYKNAPYPLVQRTFVPDVSAQAGIIIDTTSRVVLYSKNADVRLSPASTTKIMTALTALDYFNPKDILTVKRSYVEGSGLHLQKGDKLTFQNLLYAMFLPSANDAAYTVADNYPGGVTAFVKKMNEKVKLFSLTNTHFLDPAGLEDDDDYTTARDLATIASFAINHPLLAKIVSTKTATITSVLGNTYALQNLNKLLGYYGVDGIKTGTTDLAGQVLVTSSVINGHTYVIVVMKSEDRFADTEKLLRYISDNVTFLPIHP